MKGDVRIHGLDGADRGADPDCRLQKTTRGMSSERSDLSAAGVQQGDILAGKYRVDAVLGVGGMGVVVAATHLDLEQQVALKFMLSNSFANDEALLGRKDLWNSVLKNVRAGLMPPSDKPRPTAE